MGREENIGFKGMDKNNQRVGKIASPIILWGLLVIVFFRPLISGITWEWSNTYFQVLILFLIGVWLLAMVFKGRLTFLKTPLDLPILAFSLALIISTIRTVHRHVSLEQLYQLISYPLLYYLLINILRERKEIRGVVLTILTAAILVSLYGIYQNYIALERTREWVRIYHPGEFSPQFMARLETHEVFSTFVYPPALAGYLGLILPLALCLLIYAQSRWMRTLSGLTLSLGGLCLYFTYSKGGWISLFLSMVFLFAILFWNKISKYRYLFLILLLVLIIPFLFPAIREFLLEHEPLIHLQGFSDSLTVRVNYWKAGFGMLKDYPVLGSGLGTFGTIYAKYKLPQGEEVQLAHNNYLQVWTEMGILGIVSFLWLWLIFLKQGWKLIRRLRITGYRLPAAVVIGCYAGIVAFLIHSLVDFGLYVPGIAMNVWLFLALITSYQHRFLRTQKIKLATEGSKNSEEAIRMQSSYGEDRYQWEIKLSAYGKIVGSLIIVLAMAAAMIVVTRPMLAERHFSRAKDYLQAQRELPEVSYTELKEAINNQSFPLKGPLYRGRVARFSQEDLRRAAAEVGTRAEKAESINEILKLPHKEMAKLLYWVFLTKAEEELRQAVTFNPRNGTYHYHLGNLYEKIGLMKPGEKSWWLDKAMVKYEKAIKCNPFMPHYHSTLGKLLWNKARGQDKALINRAISKFEEAVRCYPTKARYRALLGRAYQLVGRKEEAMGEYKKALKLDPELKEVKAWLEKLSQ